MVSLSGDILSRRRGFFIDMVKAPLMKVIIRLCQNYPEATKENILHPNTHILIDIRDKFFEYENNRGRKDLFEAIWRVFIAEFEHDPYYRHRFEWFIHELNKRGWNPRIPTRPNRGHREGEEGTWKEPLEV